MQWCDVSTMDASGGGLLRPTNMVRAKQTGRRVACWGRAGALLLCLGGLAGAQTPCATGDKTKPCETPKTPSAAEQFPFPGEVAGDPKSVDQLPAAPAGSAPGAKGVKDQFPFPGDTSAPDAADGSSSKAGSGESSSSSGADASPDVDGKPGLKDEGTTGSTARGRRRLRPPAQKILSDDERVEEDLSVAHFYQQTGNLNGAYARTKDAVKIQPQGADAHLALAEVAQKLGKRDEAVAEYTKYLELDPDGDGVKAAKKGLEKLKP